MRGTGTRAGTRREGGGWAGSSLGVAGWGADRAEKGGAHTARVLPALEGLAAFFSPQAVRKGIIFWELTCRLQTRAPSLGWAAYRGSLEHLRGWCLCCARHFRGFICSEPAAGRSYAHFARGQCREAVGLCQCPEAPGPCLGRPVQLFFHKEGQPELGVGAVSSVWPGTPEDQRWGSACLSRSVSPSGTPGDRGPHTRHVFREPPGKALSPDSRTLPRRPDSLAWQSVAFGRWVSGAWGPPCNQAPAPPPGPGTAAWSGP